MEKINNYRHKETLAEKHKILNNTDYIRSLNSQIKYCIKHWQTWYYTSWNDLIISYRRTMIGQSWTVLAKLITLTIMCFVWSTIFKLEIKTFFPYLVNGFVIFFLINSCLIDGSTILYLRFKQVYLNIPVPILVLTIRSVAQEIFNYLHFLPVILIMYFFIFDFNFLNIILYVAGFIILIINVLLLTMLLALISTRFRDISPLVQALMGAATLLTPIFWKKDMLGEYQNWIYLNPFTSMVEMVRDPIIGVFPEIKVYLFNFLLMIFLYITNYLLIKSKGQRIIFWV